MFCLQYYPFITFIWCNGLLSMSKKTDICQTPVKKRDVSYTYVINNWMVNGIKHSAKHIPHNKLYVLYRVRYREIKYVKAVWILCVLLFECIIPHFPLLMQCWIRRKPFFTPYCVILNTFKCVFYFKIPDLFQCFSNFSTTFIHRFNKQAMFFFSFLFIISIN